MDTDAEEEIREVRARHGRLIRALATELGTPVNIMEKSWDDISIKFQKRKALEFLRFIQGWLVF